MINFGVAVARVAGECADRLLELRCECGATGCRERVRLSCGKYEALAGAGLPVLCSLHRPGLDAAAPPGPSPDGGNDARS